MAINIDAPTALFSVVVLSALYGIYWQLTVGASRRALIAEKGCLPVKAFPVKDPILGLDNFKRIATAFKEKRGLEAIAAQYDVMGVNTFSIYTLCRTIITTVEPENLKTIQALNFKHWSIGQRRKENFFHLLGAGIFTTDGGEWQHSRDMLRPNFVRSQVGDIDTFETHVNHLIKLIPTGGETVDLQDLFFRLTMDSATEFLFGESVNSLLPGAGSASNPRFAEAFSASQEILSNMGRAGIFAFMLKTKKFNNDNEYVHALVDTYVDKGMAKRDKLLSEKPAPGTRYVFIDELVRQTDDRTRIRSECLNILLAGRDTTASLLSNVWWMLSKRPDVWAKLRAEIDALNGHRPSFEEIKELKYLHAVLNESLRLHPVVPLNSREAICDTTLPRGGGPDGQSPIFIPKGQLVTWSVYRMHRRKDLYGEDADEFNPDRWMGPKGLRPGWEYLPFNGGPRICLGQQYALTEASYTTIRMMQRFKDIQSRDAEPWREWVHLTCTGAGGCKVAVTAY